jgi:hypothetical protein
MVYNFKHYFKLKGGGYGPCGGHPVKKKCQGI